MSNISSKISLGCLHFGSLLNEKISENIILESWEKGVKKFDCGALYGEGKSHKILANALKNRIHDCAITTKVGLKKKIRDDGSFGVEPSPLSKRNLISFTETTLKELSRDYIDCLMLHAFDATTPIEHTLEGIEELLAEGKIISYGVTNFNPAELQIFLHVAAKRNLALPKYFNCHWNILERMIEKELRPICLQNDIKLVPYRVLARGILSGQYTSVSDMPAGSRADLSWRVRQWITPNLINFIYFLSEKSQEHNLSLAQLSLLWSLRQAGVGHVLLGVTKSTQLSILENIQLLTEEEWKMIDDLIMANEFSSYIMSHPLEYFEK